MSLGARARVRAFARHFGSKFARVAGRNRSTANRGTASPHVIVVSCSSSLALHPGRFHSVSVRVTVSLGRFQGGSLALRVKVGVVVEHGEQHEITNVHHYGVEHAFHCLLAVVSSLQNLRKQRSSGYGSH